MRRSGAVLRPPPAARGRSARPTARKPGSTLRSRTKLRISRPAPISTTTASATSVPPGYCAGGVRRARQCRRGPPRSGHSLRLRPEPCIAGARPNRIPVARETASANPNSRRSSAAWARRGTLAGPACASNETAPLPATVQDAAAQGQQEAFREQLRHDARRGPRPARIAARSPCAAWRRAPAAGSPRSTHAISSRHPTAAISTHSARRTPPTSSSPRTNTEGRQPLIERRQRLFHLRAHRIHLGPHLFERAAAARNHHQVAVVGGARIARDSAPGERRHPRRSPARRKPAARPRPLCRAGRAGGSSCRRCPDRRRSAAATESGSAARHWRAPADPPRAGTCAPPWACTPSSGNRPAETRSPLTSSGSMCPLGPPVRLIRTSMDRRHRSTVRLCFCHARKLAGATNSSIAILRGVLLPNHQQTLRVAKRQWLQQHRVHHAENRGGSAHTERQGKQRNGGEGRGLPQQANPVPQSCPEKCMACQVNRIMPYRQGQDQWDSRATRRGSALTRPGASDAGSRWSGSKFRR